MKKFTIEHTINETDLKKLLLLDRDVFDKQDNMDECLLKEWLNINSDIYTILKYNNEPVGYINFTPLTKESYDKFRIGKNKDYKLTAKDILPFKKGDNYCLFTSIVLFKKFRDSNAIKVLWKGFLRKIKKLEKQGKHITSVIADCVSIDGIKFTLNNLYGKYICNSLNWGKIYEGNVFNKKARFPKIKMEQLNKKNLKHIAKIQYEIFKDSNGVGYCDYLEELKNHGKVGKDSAISYLIYYKHKPVGVIGLIRYSKYLDDIFLNWFGILPKYRGRGIGTIALINIIKKARNYNVKNFRIYSDVLWHKVAQNIYRKTMQREEVYCNEEDSFRIERQGEFFIYSTSLVDKVAPKWNNKFLNLTSEILLHKESIKRLKEDKLI